MAEATVVPADTAFMLVSAALVMFMTPGLGLFYGGMTRQKNVLSTIMHSFVMLGLVSVLWYLFGYSLSFGDDVGGLIGDFKFLLLNGVGEEGAPLAATIPHTTFMVYQCMFAVITPALITGAFAERIKFISFFVFSALWLIVVYCPMAHWVWGGGWMQKMGALDFAGGAVVHMSSGAAALAGATILGRRKGYGEVAMIPHNLPMTVTGAGILWFGWFGFNAGSALAASGLASTAFINTHIAASAGALAWILMESLHHGKPTTLGVASGAVAGLVAITPAAGFVTPMPAIIIGAGGGVLCYFGIMLKSKFKFDDALDVVGVHGVGGAWGALATGLFATKAVNPAGADGLFYGNPEQLWIQFVSVAATVLFCFTASWILFKIVDLLFGLRVSENDETQGLDVSQHNEAGYQIH